MKDIDIERCARRGVKVISLGGRVSEYDSILQSLFVELANDWDIRTPQLSKFSDEESSVEFSLPQDASRLCFFEVNELLSFYKSNIFPIFEQ